MINIGQTAPIKRLYDSDINGRIIDIYKLSACKVADNSYYPNCFLTDDQEIINPYMEKIMSLGDTLNKSIEFNYLNGKETIYDNPLFFFVYNTDNYYHFVYDTLPYLISFLNLKKEIPNLKLLMNYPNSYKKDIYRFVLEFLELIGIQNEDIIIIDNNTIYKTIYISSSFTHGMDSNMPPREEIYDFYKSLVKKAKELSNKDYSEYKRIYISRRTWLHGDTSNIGTNYTNRRKMKCEDNLAIYLLKNEYKEIFTENLSTIDKILIFDACEVVIGAIGGGLCNVLFSKPDCILISINSPTFMDINNRFKYCFSKVEVSYEDNTYHTETTYWKKYMRVKCGDIIGEIKEILENSLIITYANENVAGWNSDSKYNEIEVEKSKCCALDRGLNSEWNFNLKDFKLIFDWIIKPFKIEKK